MGGLGAPLPSPHLVARISEQLLKPLRLGPQRLDCSVLPVEEGLVALRLGGCCCDRARVEAANPAPLLLPSVHVAPRANSAAVGCEGRQARKGGLLCFGTLGGARGRAAADAATAVP